MRRHYAAAAALVALAAAASPLAGGVGLRGAQPLLATDAQPSPSATLSERFVMVSGASQDIASTRGPAFHSQACYAARHGYRHAVEFEESLAQGAALAGHGRWYNPWWAKLFAIEKHLPHADWVVWLDADAVVTNFTVKLEWFTRGAKDDVGLIMTDHPVCINDGIIFVRGGAAGRRVLADWKLEAEEGYRAGAGEARWAWDDNGALMHVLVRRAGGESYDGKCGRKGTFDDDKRLSSCVQDALASYGASYGKRLDAVPGVRIVPPGGYDAGGGAPVRGAFDAYKRSDFDGGFEWVVQGWTQEVYWREGDFVRHVYKKSELAGAAPDSLAWSCEAAASDEARKHALVESARRAAAAEALRREVSVVAAKAVGVSCDEACSGAGRRCDAEATVALANSCDALRRHLGCRGGCRKDFGPSNPSDGPPAPGGAEEERQCMVHAVPRAKVTGTKCSATHHATRRLCACR